MILCIYPIFSLCQGLRSFSTARFHPGLSTLPAATLRFFQLFKGSAITFADRADLKKGFAQKQEGYYCSYSILERYA